MTLLALALTRFDADPNRMWEERAAAALTVILVVAGFAVPWLRLPGWTHPIVPLAYFPVIALLRDAHGGAPSGYGPLCVMPVFWLALFGTRRHLALSLTGVALVFVGPVLLIGDGRYPPSEWRAAVLWTSVLAIVGYRVQALVADSKRRAGLARDHARELAETQTALQTIAQLAREVSSRADARRLICETAISGSGATVATVVEPDGRGGFHVTGSAGIPIDFEQIRQDVRPNASLRAFYSRERLFVADAATHEGISSIVIETTGVKSAVFEPIIRHDRPVGILAVGWTKRRNELDERTDTLISFLAAEAGAAIERADLIAQLDLLAHTDQLTGLPNRRYWDEHAPALIETHDGEPLCVAIVDLDHFKSYNDRYGHPAGDALLRRAAAAWRAHLRPSDLLARYGGEEFAVLLPECTLGEAEQVLERLRTATPTVTCSVGLAEHTLGETLDELTDRADLALYQAKRKGRDRLIAA
jgi:diguanylate cyclase (GGDEF)-like protein